MGMAGIFKTLHGRYGNSFEWKKDLHTKFQQIPTKITGNYLVPGEEPRVDMVYNKQRHD